MGKSNGRALRIKWNGGFRVEELFTYIDIFSAKGMEYLIIIGFFIVIVAFWKFVNMPPY
jgi:hypothetical protein